MNRLILIGNGFDLAHGLKTSYKDFIEHLWLGIYEELSNESIKGQRTLSGEDSFEFVNKDNLINVFYTSLNLYNYYIRIVSNSKSHKTYLINKSSDAKSLSQSINLFINFINQLEHIYPNNFFKIISENYTNKNWSDIEADYYRELKNKRDEPKLIKKLNEDFRDIKELLRKYLSGLEEHPKIESIKDIIFSPLETCDFKLSSKNIIRDDIDIKVNLLLNDPSIKKWLNKTFPLNKHREEEGIKNKDEIVNDILKFGEKDYELQDFFLPDRILILNFNYTKTEELYKNLYVKNRMTDTYINIEINHIHGTLDDDDNHMIFGYGDEEDDEYKELEKSETPGLLDNVKSINYLEATNYRNMERFIESAPYQIFIMGMSCGMADRTMLRKLFQHNNCISIKPFYYKSTDKDGKEWDNYTEIVQNISRCFSDKDLLRSTVVNKKDCSLLPQCNIKE
jgi:hypothetical protein